MMKILTYLLLFLCCTVSAQQSIGNINSKAVDLPYTNNKEAQIVLYEFVATCQEKDIPLDRLKYLDSIVVKYYDKPKAPLSDNPARAYYQPKGLHGTIMVHKSMLDRDQFYKFRWSIFHELGHHFGIEHCMICEYNIMTGKQSEWPIYLYKNSNIRKVFEDMFFERIRDPVKEHKHY